MNRQGAVLIEVLAAIVILAVAGVTTIEFLTATLDAQTRMRARELEMGQAERLLGATALLTERELDQRIGVRPADEFLVWVGRPEPALYRIGVSAAARPEDELLATLVYRRSRQDLAERTEPTDAP